MQKAKLVYVKEQKPFDLAPAFFFIDTTRMTYFDLLLLVFLSRQNIPNSNEIIFHQHPYDEALLQVFFYGVGHEIIVNSFIE
jgi:hypothetical protein